MSVIVICTGDFSWVQAWLQSENIKKKKNAKFLNGPECWANAEVCYSRKTKITTCFGLYI